MRSFPFAQGIGCFTLNSLSLNNQLPSHTIPSFVSFIKGAMRKQTTFLFLALTCLFFSCIQRSPGEKMISEGRKVFLKRCSSCHGIHAEGKPGIPSLKNATEEFTDDAIRSFILNGRGKGKIKMPPVRRISEQEIIRVILWLKTLSEGDKSSPLHTQHPHTHSH